VRWSREVALPPPPVPPPDRTEYIDAPIVVFPSDVVIAEVCAARQRFPDRCLADTQPAHQVDRIEALIAIIGIALLIFGLIEAERAQPSVTASAVQCCSRSSGT